MPRIAKRYLDAPQILVCAACKTHLSSEDQIESRDFKGESGKAFLIHRVVNATLGPSTQRTFITGLHTVSDIYCITCQCKVGWTYEEAFEEDQKYKVGKFILEEMKIDKAS